jgi:hypothetical protein
MSFFLAFIVRIKHIAHSCPLKLDDWGWKTGDTKALKEDPEQSAPPDAPETTPPTTSVKSEAIPSRCSSTVSEVARLLWKICDNFEIWSIWSCLQCLQETMVVFHIHIYFGRKSWPHHTMGTFSPNLSISTIVILLYCGVFGMFPLLRNVGVYWDLFFWCPENTSVRLWKLTMN